MFKDEALKRSNRRVIRSGEIGSARLYNRLTEFAQTFKGTRQEFIKAVRKEFQTNITDYFAGLVLHR